MISAIGISYVSWDISTRHITNYSKKFQNNFLTVSFLLLKMNIQCELRVVLKYSPPTKCKDLFDLVGAPWLASCKLVAKSLISASSGPPVLSSFDSWLLRNLSMKSKAWLNAATLAALSSVDNVCDEGGLCPWVSSFFGVPGDEQTFWTPTQIVLTPNSARFDSHQFDEFFESNKLN